MTTTLAYVFPPYRLLPSTRQLLCDVAPIKLGGRAFDLLVSLVERRDRIVSKNEIMDLVWSKLVVEENNLQVHIVALRKVLGHPAIATVPGRGYRFTLPVTQEGTDPLARPARSAPSLPTEAARGTNLPTRLPVLFGRDEDLHSLLGLLDRHGLVTVVGSAGIGKTRLAQAAASACIKETLDGVWWVDLAPLTDASLVPGAVAIALGLHLDGAADVTAAVLTLLREQASLLVLDNAEHLLDGLVDFVIRLRRAAPQTRLLVTSQEALHIVDECVFRPEPLSLPEGDDPERISLSGAVALFVARAQEADRRFELRPENRGVVAEVCRRLDGIPLAIELAAARVPLLGVEGLRDKLDQRFRVLTTGRRTSLRRHQTLRAALEWSTHLLSPAEQAVMRRLGVFSGGFTLEAAQQVAEDASIDCWDILEHLGALVEKSLVMAEGEAVPRYRMLETTRLFALERLIDSGEAYAVRQRHRDHFLQIAEECQRHLLTGDTRRHISRLDQDRDNLLVALAWAPGDDDAILGMRLAAAMSDYWYLRAMPALGVQVTRVALERPGAQAHSLERCRALVTAGWMCTLASQDDEAVRYMAEALRLARDVADAVTLCLVLTKFAHVRHHRTETEEALRLASEAVAVGRPLGDCVELSDALNLRAHVHARCGEREPARALFLEALSLRKRLNNATGMISVRMNLAYMAIDAGSPDDAKPHLDEALALMPLADSQRLGIHFIGLTAQWAALVGRHEDSVLLEAACDRQLDRAGMRNELERVEAERLERAGLALEAQTRERLESKGRVLSYEQALQRVAISLKGEPSFGLTRSPT